MEAQGNLNEDHRGISKEAFFLLFLLFCLPESLPHNIKEKLLEQRHNNNNAHKHSARFKAARGEKRASETRVLLVKVAHTTP